MTELIPLGLCSGSVAFTLAKSSMPLIRTLREWLTKRSKFAAELLHCPYCTSHWVSLPLVIFYQPRFIESHLPFVDFLVSWFAVVGAAMVPIFMLMFIAKQD